MEPPVVQRGTNRMPTSTKVRQQVAALDAELQVKLKQLQDLQLENEAQLELLKQLKQALQQQPPPLGTTGPSGSTQCRATSPSACPRLGSGGHTESELPVPQLAAALRALWQHTMQERQRAGQGCFSDTADQVAERTAILRQLRGCWCTILQAIAGVLHQQQQQQRRHGPTQVTTQHQQQLVQLLQTLRLILQSLAQASPCFLWHFLALGTGAAGLPCSSDTVMAQPLEAASPEVEQQAAAAAAAHIQPASVAFTGTSPRSSSHSAGFEPADGAGAVQQHGSSSSSDAGNLHHSNAPLNSGHLTQPPPPLAVPAAHDPGTYLSGRGCFAIDDIGGLPLPDLEQLLALEGDPMPAAWFGASVAAAGSLCDAGTVYRHQECDPGLDAPVVEYRPAPPPAAAAAAAGAAGGAWVVKGQQLAAPAAAVAWGGAQQQQPAQGGQSGNLFAQLATVQPCMGAGNMTGTTRLNSSNLNNLAPCLNPPVGRSTSTGPGMACSSPLNVLGHGTPTGPLPLLNGALYDSSTPSGRGTSVSAFTGSLPSYGLLSCSSSNTSTAVVQGLPPPGIVSAAPGLGPLPHLGLQSFCEVGGWAQKAVRSAAINVMFDNATRPFACIGPAAAAAAVGAAPTAPSPWQPSQGLMAASLDPPPTLPTVAAAAAAAATPTTASKRPAGMPASECSRWRLVLDRLQLQPSQVTQLLHLHGAHCEAQEIHHLRLSELSQRLVDLSHASTQRLPGAGEASCGLPSGQGLLGMAGAELLEAADELQHLLLEGRQLTNGLLLEVWGPQSPLTPNQCCRGLVAALPSLPDTGALLELLAEQRQQQPAAHTRGCRDVPRGLLGGTNARL